MKNILNSIDRKLAIPFWGIIGGLALIFIAGLEHNANAVIPIFGLTLISTILTIKLWPSKKLLTDLFKSTFIVYTIMILIDYLFIITIINPGMLHVNLLGHFWRVILMLSIGAIVSWVLSFISSILIGKKRMASN